MEGWVCLLSVFGLWTFRGVSPHFELRVSLAVQFAVTAPFTFTVTAGGSRKIVKGGCEAKVYVSVAMP